MSDFQRYKQHTAKKERKCDLCGGVIEIGNIYQINKGVNQGLWFESKECLDCQPIIREFMDADWGDGGYCAEWIQEWWRDYKCIVCVHYYSYLCEPDSAICNPDGCQYLTVQKTCKCADTCDDMTHFCRCKKFEHNGG